MTHAISLRSVLSRCFPFFGYAAFFSFVLQCLGLAAPIYMMSVFDRVLPSRSNETLLVLSGVFVFAILIEVMLDKRLGQLFKRLGDMVYLKLRQPVVDGLLQFQPKNEGGERALDDLETLRMFLSGQGLRAMFDIPWIPIFLFVLWLFHPLLFMVALCSAVLMLFLTFLEEEITRKNQKLAETRERESRGFLGHAMNNREIVSALAMGDAVQSRWLAMNDRYFSEAIKARRKVGFVEGLSHLIKKLQRIVGLSAGAYLVLNVDGMTPGIMLASTIIMAKAISPMMTVIGSWRSFQSGRGAYRRLSDFMKSLRTQPGFKPPAPRGAVDVENLLYFINRDRNILNGIHFTLESGEALGVIGPSASGKTSLARLLVGVATPCDGHVRLDGAEIGQWSANGLGEWLGYVPQQPQLFPGTVADNIARMQDSHHAVDQILKACEKAGIHEAILRMPQGYDTEVGPGGSHLSGGQRQLIALARAVFGDPRFVVMDEPNAFLDGNGETLLMELINRLKRDGVTQIIISHKPSILRNVDKLLVLGQGRQAMFGPRREILRRMNQADSNVTPLPVDAQRGHAPPTRFPAAEA